jgi:hypothetical protein
VSTDRTGLRSGAAVVIAAVGPLAIAVLRLILPYDTTDDTAATVEKVAAAPAVEGVVLWLTYLALLTLPLGVLIAARQAIRARPVLGAVAAVVAWLGFTSLFASVAIGDYLAQAAPQQRPDLGYCCTAGCHQRATRNLDGLTCVRGRPHPRRDPARHRAGAGRFRLIGSRPGHFAAAAFRFAVFVPNHVLDGVAWALTAMALQQQPPPPGRLTHCRVVHTTAKHLHHYQ